MFQEQQLICYYILFYIKKNTTFNLKKVAIIDSGLGGLSVQAMLDKLWRKQQIAKDVELVYYDVGPKDGGYQQLPFKECAVIFNKMLCKVAQFEPDIILLACNTLTTVYPHTDFAQNTNIDVMGIIEVGVELMRQKWQTNNEISFVILGTPITTNSNIYPNLLQKAGIPLTQIIAQNCENLAVFIQIGATKTVEEKIVHYLQSAKQRLPKQAKHIAIGLCCTHYGYATEKIRIAAQQIFDKQEVQILNPNQLMAQMFVNKCQKSDITPKRYATIVNGCFSNATIDKSHIENIGQMIIKDAPAVYDALKNYQLWSN